MEMTRQKMGITEPIEERVEKGIDLLDERRPGWEQKVLLGRLDMANPEWCVLAQTGKKGENYMDSYDTFNLGEEYYGGTAHGFAAANYGEFYQLGELWREEIRARRKK